MKTLLLVLQLVPVLIKAIEGIEQLIPAGGKGKDKLALIQQIMVMSYDGIMDIWPTIQNVIGAIVNVANVTGAFTKGEDGEPKGGGS